MMTKTEELKVAQLTLSEIIAGLGPNDEVLIVQDHKPVAKLVASGPARKPRKAGNCKGMLTVDSEDDDHLKDFVE